MTCVMRYYAVFGILLIFYLRAVRSADIAIDVNGTMCPPGANCSLCGMCHFNDSCDVKTGFCPRDCAPGYKGKGCIIFCNASDDCENPCPCNKPCQCDRQRFICNTECEELIMHGDTSSGGQPSKTVVYLALGLACGLIVFAGCFVWKSDQCLDIRQPYLPDVRGDGPHQVPFNSPMNLHYSVARSSLRRGNDIVISSGAAHEGNASGDAEENRRKKHYRKDRRFANSGMSPVAPKYPFDPVVLSTDRPLTRAYDVPFDTRALSGTWPPVLSTNPDMEDTRSTLDTLESPGTPETLSSSSRRLAAVCGSTDMVSHENVGTLAELLSLRYQDSTQPSGVQRPPCGAEPSPRQDAADMSQGHNSATDASVGNHGAMDTSIGHQDVTDTQIGHRGDTEMSPGHQGDTDTSPGHRGDTDKSPGHQGDTETSQGNQGDIDTSPGHWVATDMSLGHQGVTDTSQGDQSATDTSVGHQDVMDMHTGHQGATDTPHWHQGATNTSQGQQAAINTFRRHQGVADKIQRHQDAVMTSSGNQNATDIYPGYHGDIETLPGCPGDANTYPSQDSIATSPGQQGATDVSRGHQGAAFTSQGHLPTSPTSDQSQNRVSDPAVRDSSASHPSDMPPDESLSPTGQRSPEPGVKQQQGPNVLHVLPDSPLEGLLPAPQPPSDTDHAIPSAKD